MIRAIIGAIIFVACLVGGSALFGIDPTWQEIALVLVAATIADVLTGS